MLYLHFPRAPGRRRNTQDEQQNMQASIIWPAMGELGRLN